MQRIGIGYDIHKLVEGRKLILGGVPIPFEKGLLGHSDGDALLHAIADAVFGALSQGDIGKHFPDDDPACKNMDSGKILEKAVMMIEKDGFKISNVDANIIAERPKMGAHFPKMQARVAEILKVNPKQVSLKARSNEGLDAVGRGEAIAVQAVVLLERIKWPS